MKIAADKVVELIYDLIVDGQLVDHMTEEKPLDYIHGNRCLLEKFESNIDGLEPGDAFSFTLTPEEGYGEVDPERIIDLPVDIFVGQDGKLMEDFMKVGAMVPLVNGAGQVVPGRVLEVSEKTVKMDLNSPMAGKTLNFSGKILSVRDATEKELKEGLHGEYVMSNCKGGCGHHGNGCGHHGGGNCHSGCNGGCHDDGCGDGGCHEDGCHGGDCCHEGGCKGENGGC